MVAMKNPNEAFLPQIVGQLVRIDAIRFGPLTIWRLSNHQLVDLVFQQQIEPLRDHPLFED